MFAPAPAITLGEANGLGAPALVSLSRNESKT
jgi:hypothetical protein